MSKLGDNLSVQRGSPPVRAAAAVADTPIPPRPKPQARTWIVLEENVDIPPTGLFVGINGNSFMIRAGEEVCVPQSVIEVLNNAITQVPVQDPYTQKVLGHRKKMRFPYRLVVGPAPVMAA